MRFFQIVLVSYVLNISILEWEQMIKASVVFEYFGIG
jgi:hypothetical protein